MIIKERMLTFFYCFHEIGTCVIHNKTQKDVTVQCNLDLLSVIEVIIIRLQYININKI